MRVIWRSLIVAYVVAAIFTGHFVLAFAPFLLVWFGRRILRRLTRKRTPRLPRSERRRRQRRNQAVSALTSQGVRFSRAYTAVANAERDGAYCLVTTAQEALRR